MSLLFRLTEYSLRQHSLGAGFWTDLTALLHLLTVHGWSKAIGHCYFILSNLRALIILTDNSLKYEQLWTFTEILTDLAALILLALLVLISLIHS